MSLRVVLHAVPGLPEPDAPDREAPRAPLDVLDVIELLVVLDPISDHRQVLGRDIRLAPLPRRVQRAPLLSLLACHAAS
jgi:hypothetical protein